jgi:hypothetical protein
MFDLFYVIIPEINDTIRVYGISETLSNVPVTAESPYSNISEFISSYVSPGSAENLWDPKFQYAICVL